MPELAPVVDASNGVGRLRRRHPRGPGRDPARLPDADLRLRGHLPRARRSARARAARRSCARRNRLPFDSNVHLHGGYVPAAHDGHPMDVIQPGKGFDYTYPNDQDAAFLWYHDHAHGRTARTLYYGLVATYLLGDEREEELELPAGRVRRAARARRPRVQQGRLVPLRGERRPRLPRRHDPRQRRGLAAHARASAGSTGCASSTRPTRAPTTSSSATAADAADRHRRRAARARRCARSSVPLHPAERIEVLVDFRALPAGLGDRAAERRAARRRPSTVMRFDVVARRRQRGGADPARAHAHAREAARAERDAAAGTSRCATRRACSGRSPAAASTRRASTCRPRLGTIELWQWHNPSNRVHPMHLHGMLFRIVERSTGRRPPGRARLEGHGRRAARARRSRCSRGSSPTPAATCSTATRSSTATRR